MALGAHFGLSLFLFGEFALLTWALLIVNAMCTALDAVHDPA
ncbi:hypothetical protein [Methylobacterium sp.]